MKTSTFTQKRQLNFHKILAILALFLTSAVFAQEIGDLRSREDGNWLDSSTWEEYDGSTWKNTSKTPGDLFTGDLEIRHTVYAGKLQQFWIWLFYTDMERQIDGNLTISSGGNLQLTKNNRERNIRMLVSGNFKLNGGTLSLYAGNNNNSSVNAGSLVVDGNVDLLSGSIESNSVRVPSGIYLAGNTIQNFTCNINLPQDIVNRFYTIIDHPGINETYGGTNVSTVHSFDGLFYSDSQTWQNNDNLIKNFTVNTTGTLLLNTDKQVNAILNLADGILDVQNHHLKLNSSSFVQNGGQIKNQDANGILEFANQNSISIPSSTFNGAISNLKISASGGLKIQEDISITNGLYLNANNPNATDGLLDLVISYNDYAEVAYNSVANFYDSTQSFNNLNSYILYMGENAKTYGIGDVTGKIKRTVINNEIAYDYGNKNTTLLFKSFTGDSGLPDSILVTVTRGTEGEHVDNLSENTILFGEAEFGPRAAVKRLLQIQYTATEELPASTRFTLRMAYQADELNSNTESELIAWDHHLPYGGATPHEHGKTGNNLEEGWVELTNHSVLYLTKEGASSGDGTITKYWMLSEKETIGEYMWLGAVNSDWNVISNWSGSKVPNENANVYIPSTYNYAPVITESSGYADAEGEVITGEVRMRTIEIAPNAELQVQGSPTIKVYGGPNVGGGGVNYGTFNILGSVQESNSTVYLIDDASASEITLNGNLKFYNLVAQENAKINILNNASIEILNDFSIHSTSELDAVSNPNTITFSGSGQTIPNPGLTNVGFYNLVIDGENSILPTQLNIHGSFTQNESGLDLSSTKLVFEGDSEQQINSSQTSLNLNHIELNLNAKLSSTVNELQLGQVDLVNGTFEVANTNKVIFNDTIIKTNGTLSGQGTFEFVGLNEIENNLFENNRSTANIILNRNTSNFTVPNNFAVEGTLHLEKGEVNLGTNTLELAGNLSSNLGAVNAQNAELVFSGNNSQSISGNALTNNSVKDIRMDGMGTFNIVENVNLTGVLTPNSGILNSTSTLTFKSTANHTAVVDEVSANAEIQGNVIVERHIPAKRAFRFINPSVTSLESIHANWQEGAIKSSDDPSPGYGTHVTGNGYQSATETLNENNNGFDWNPSGSPSLFYFDNVNQNWIPVENTNVEQIDATKSYRIMVRGSRAIDISSNDSKADATILRTKGTLNQDTYIHNENLKFDTQSPNFIGNPYQAPIDLAKVVESSVNLSKYVYVWDPTISDPESEITTRGAFVNVDVIENKTSNADSEANRFLQPGQAAYFYAESPSVDHPMEVVFLESHKAINATQTQVFGTSNDQFNLSLKLYDKNSFLSGRKSTDAFLIRFSDQFADAVNFSDGAKQENLNENFARLQNGKLLSIEERTLPNENDILPLFINQFQHEEYIIQLDANNLPEDLNIFLSDHYLNETINLSDTNFIYEFNVDSNINASTAYNRFSLEFSNESLSINEEQEERFNFKVYPNPVVNNAFEIRSSKLIETEALVNVYDMLGNLVLSHQASFNSKGSASFDNLNLNTGIYLVQVIFEELEISKKIIVK